MYFNKESKLIHSNIFKNAKEISIYDAIELVTYNNFTWIDETNLDPYELLERYPPKDVEEYGWCLVFSEEYYKANKEEKEWIGLLKLYSKDFILLHCYGEVELFHMSDNYKNINKEGYKPDKLVVEMGGGSFAIGLYAYATHANPRFKKGVFKGHYFKCICDPNGIKDGTASDNFQELFFPYNTNKIKWEGI